ncbi:hypothetical protein CRG49_005230 [Neisseria sp. N95_16]|uniref:Uncharacterized protein n=1 Tax=Neisseria brasiliensis TaxID=2666100 RepID=A0A5Q3RZD5_9NEIS|nr:MULTISPECIES: hypothetical protein [Neisseria]MRN38130.1 hypothetical protein [Neisseria brasiliensis]PJO09882.1 hypothetical protein CRG49_005230 [Neisseria sp. N95_16]PJO79044.1 hypothetical protein CWC45_01850 [Neisseria sp. N177_16]QGL25119.1 hypothetical protein GJV52_05955 [Neisseria brasiliensis]
MRSLVFFIGWALFFTLLFGGISWLARALDLPNASLWISVAIAVFIGLLPGKKIARRRNELVALLETGRLKHFSLP